MARSQAHTDTNACTPLVAAGSRCEGARRSAIHPYVAAVPPPCSDAASSTPAAHMQRAADASVGSPLWTPRESQGSTACKCGQVESVVPEPLQAAILGARWGPGKVWQAWHACKALILGACARTCPACCQSGYCRGRRRWEAQEKGLQTNSCVLARILCRARAHVRESSELDVIHSGRERSGQTLSLEEGVGGAKE